MNATMQDDLQEVLRRIVREEVRPIIREETQIMRDDIAAIRAVQGAQDLRLQSITADLGSMNATLRAQTHETTRLGTLLEDFEHRFAAVKGA